LAQALSVFLTFVAVFLAGCGTSRPEAAPGPSQEAKGFTLTRSRAGLMEWKLESPRATFDEAASKAQLESPKIALYQKGKPETFAKAREGEVDLTTQDMLLTGAVEVDNKADQTTLKTDQLRYFSSSKEFRTERPVEIRRPEGVMRGRGLTANHDLTRIKVLRQETRLQ
jgi:LPS export ABC transporter protein LptC